MGNKKLWILNLGMNRDKFYYCEDYKCNYYESYVPMKNETSAGKEIVSHDDLVNFDNDNKENYELEKMLQLIGSHVVQCTFKIDMLLLLVIMVIVLSIMMILYLTILL